LRNVVAELRGEFCGRGNASTVPVGHRRTAGLRPCAEHSAFRRLGFGYRQLEFVHVQVREIARDLSHESPG